MSLISPTPGSGKTVVSPPVPKALDIFMEAKAQIILGKVRLRKRGGGSENRWGDEGPEHVAVILALSGEAPTVNRLQTH